MTLCQLTDDMKTNLRNKLLEIGEQVDSIVKIMDEKEGCLLCEITNIKNLAHELEVLASFYHFQSSLLPNVEGMDEIAKALAALSEKRHGALMAIEQNDSLEPYIKSCESTGVFIGAKVSAPLLQSIFYPGNPLHDGSIVIREGEIVSAGCVFPLSNRKYTGEGRKIGTRHRAALGLSERSDALIITVSEETGRVSFALNGILHSIEINLCENLKEQQVKFAPLESPLM